MRDQAIFDKIDLQRIRVLRPVRIERSVARAGERSAAQVLPALGRTHGAFDPRAGVARERQGGCQCTTESIAFCA